MKALLKTKTPFKRCISALFFSNTIYDHKTNKTTKHTFICSSSSRLEPMYHERGITHILLPTSSSLVMTNVNFVSKREVLLHTLHPRCCLPVKLSVKLSVKLPVKLPVKCLPILSWLHWWTIQSFVFTFLFVGGDAKTHTRVAPSWISILCPMTPA